MKNLPCRKKLKKLNLKSVEGRRQQDDMIDALRVIQGTNRDDTVLTRNTDLSTRNSGFKLDSFILRERIMQKLVIIQSSQ